MEPTYHHGYDGFNRENYWCLMPVPGFYNLLTIPVSLLPAKAKNLSYEPWIFQLPDARK